MGQYYMAYVEQDGVGKGYDNPGFLKLMEHSWLRNDYVGQIARLIYKKPSKVAWVGDYSDDFESNEGFPRAKELHDLIWGGEVPEKLDVKPLSVIGKVLANHTQKCYVRFCSVPKDKDGWKVNLLPLLTAVGNGLGGGDYRGPLKEYIGDWYLEEISVENRPPEGYDEVFYNFVDC